MIRHIVGDGSGTLHWLDNWHPLGPLYDFVWFPQNVPIWAFIQWIYCWNTLASKDRIKGLGMDVDEICVVCNQMGESHDHLFFECDYSKICLLGKNQISRLPGNWSY